MSAADVRTDEVLDAARPLRIAHVITRLINGGADENTVLSCNHATRTGHEVVLVHGGQADPEILARADARVQLIALPNLVRPFSPLSDLRGFRDLVRIIRRLKPDVVHTHTSKAGILGRLAARSGGVPVVVHSVHNTVPFVGFGRLETVAYLAAERAVQRLTDAFVDISASVRDLYVGAGIGATERHHVVRSGFDVQRFGHAAPPEDWRDLLRLRPDEPRPPSFLCSPRLRRTRGTWSSSKASPESLPVTPMSG